MEESRFSNVNFIAGIKGIDRCSNWWWGQVGMLYSG